MTSPSLRFASLACLTALSACSALIDVDLARLSPPADSASDLPIITDVPSLPDEALFDLPAPDDAPDAADTQDAPDTSDVPVTLDVTDVPVPPDVTDVPVPPDVTDVPVIPDVTDAPVIPDVTDAPDVPVTRCPGGCNDMIDCTVDRCDELAGRCVFRPDSTLCGARGVCDPARRGCVTVECTLDSQCQNSTLCDGRETCASGRCTPGVPVSCDDRIACTVDSCNPATGACAHAQMNSRCDDGRYCNGVEACNPATGCVGGIAPACADSIPCTVDTCSDSVRACLHMPNPALCTVRGPCVTAACMASVGCVYTPVPRFCEGFCVTGGSCNPSTGVCMGGTMPRDCTDRNPCTTDTCDPTAMTCRSAAVDIDHDGFPAAVVGSTVCAGGSDCNDTNPMINPRASEVCDRVDNNCNGMTDEGGACSVPGDTCAAAIAVDMTSRASATLMATTVGASAELTDPCGGRMNDVFFAITYPATANLMLEAIPMDPEVDPVLSLRTACNRDIFVCNDDAANVSGTAARLWVRPTGATGNLTLFAMVKMTDREGVFRLNVTVTQPGTPPALCASSALFDVSLGGALFSGFSAGMSQHRSNVCVTPNNSGVSTEDVVVFNTPTRRRVTTVLYAATPVLYIRNGRCTGAGSTELRCASGATSAQITTDLVGNNFIFADAGTAFTRSYVMVVYPE